MFNFYIIFQFSSENSEKSRTRISSVMRKIAEIFSYTKNLSEATKTKIVKRAQPIIRKLAHFSFYTLVGILIMAFVSTYRFLLWRKLELVLWWI